MMKSSESRNQGGSEKADGEVHNSLRALILKGEVEYIEQGRRRKKKIELVKDIKGRYEDLCTGRCRHCGGRRALTK